MTTKEKNVRGKQTPPTKSTAARSPHISNENTQKPAIQKNEREKKREARGRQGEAARATETRIPFSSEMKLTTNNKKCKS